MSNQKTIVLPSEGDSEDKPLVLQSMRPYIEIDSSSDETLTNEADLNIINNFLEITANAVEKMTGIGGLAILSANALRLIEARRKIKNLPFGVRAVAKQPNDAKRKLVVIE